MRARKAPSRLLALGFVLAAGAALLAVLLGESARVPLRTPLVERAARQAPLSVQLEGRESSRGTTLYRVELRAPDARELLRHEELALFLDGGPGKRRFVAARLELRGRGCALAAAGGDELTSRAPVVLRWVADCEPAAEGEAALDFSIEVAGTGSVELLGFQRSEGARPAPLQIAPARGREAPLDVRGAFLDYPPTLPRIVLLNHMWRLGPGHGWLLALVGLSVLLAGAGVLVFPVGPLHARTRGVTLARAACGTALCAGALAVLHAVIDPPLSGPDEPYHLLGFAGLVEDDALARDTVAWMGETHLWRIRQQPAERFRSIDMGRPYLAPDDQLRPTEVAMRSALTARLWRAVAPLARGQGAPRALLRLRLVNAFLFALAVGAAAAVATALVAEPFAQWLAYPFLFVPALPFFAMHVSETAALCAVYVLLAAGVVAMVMDGPRAHWAGPLLGLATGLMLAGGRSPWPLLALIATLLAVRAALATLGAERPARAAIVFWGGFGLGATLLYAIADYWYRLMTDTYVLHFSLFAPEAVRGLVLWTLSHPPALLGMALVGGGLEQLLAGLRGRIARRHHAHARAFVERAGRLLAAAIVLSLVLSLVVHFPQLPLSPREPLSPSQRLAAALATAATTFRLAEPNFLLASSFWVGFGWLDTMPGPVFQGLLVGLAGISLAVFLVAVARRRDVRRFLWLVALGLGALASLAVYTLSTQDRETALQGRYLIGWYLCVLAGCGGSLALGRDAPSVPDVSPEGGGGTRAAFLLVLAGAIHVYCLAFILQRYF